jgi:iron complex outermembrane receptor protein
MVYFQLIMKKLFLILWVMIIGQTLSGQAVSLNGTVIDAETGNPLSGAHIFTEGEKYKAISDYSGSFKISNLPEGNHFLRITYIGYETDSSLIEVIEGKEITRVYKLKAKLYLAEEAVITANRIEVSRNITPMTVSLVNRNSLENGGESNLLPIVGKLVPGVFVTERGVTGFGVGDGSAGNISIRGIGGSPNTQVLVLIDGHPQYMGLFGHPLPDAYVASDAEKVEVVRGPASILYGSNAMGGVINIISRKQAGDGISLHAKAGYGSFNTFKFNGAVGFRKKKLQAFVSFNKDKTDGHRDNSDFNLDNIYAKFSYDLNPHFRLWIDGSLARYESTNPGPVGTSDTTYEMPTHWQSITRGYTSGALENKYQKSAGALKFYYNWGNHSLWDGFESMDKNYGLMLYQAFHLFKGNTITAGYDYVSYGGTGKNIIPEVPVVFVDTSVMETGAYALIQQNFIDRVTVSAGLRYQYHELFKSVWIPQFGASYLAAEYTTVKAGISKGYRSPSIRELFMFRPANPDLDPESIWNYEAGVMQKFFGQKLSLDFTSFYSKGNNLIETTGVFPDVMNFNTGDFEHYGIEFQGKYIILKDLDVLLNYSWLHTAKPVVAAPKNQLYAEGNYRLQSFQLHLSLQYINQLTTLTSPLNTVSYALLSARVSYTYDHFLTFFLDGNNLTDQSYEINYGYPMPGIAVFGGISVKWQKGL